MLLRFFLFITSTSGYRLFIPLLLPPCTAVSSVAVAAACSNFPTISRMDVNRLTPYFSSCTVPSSRLYPRCFSYVGTIGNKYKKKYEVSKNRKYRYLYPVKVRNHGIYVWNIIHFERVEKALSFWKAVRVDNKQRLGFLEENGQLFIRANQGHSVEFNYITSAEDIPVCVHGTYKRFLDSILQSGLKRMGRLHVHFSSGLPSDNEVISGMRRDINVVIFLDVNKALEDRMKLYMSENKVILTEGFDGVVPAKYFSDNTVMA